jgi:hypothetical protein
MNKFKEIFKSSFVVILSIIIVAGISFAAGSLSPISPTVTNTSYTLTDLDNLKSNIRVSAGSGQLPSAPAGNPALTFKSISDVYNDITAELDKLTPDKIVEGTTAFGIVGTAAAIHSELTWQPPISGTSTYQQLCYSAGAFERAGDPALAQFSIGPCFAGNVPGNGLTIANEGAVEYCENLNIGGNSNWRLPTPAEYRYALTLNFILNGTTGGFVKYDTPVTVTSGGTIYSPGIYWTSLVSGQQRAITAYYSDTLGLSYGSSMSRVTRNAVRCVHD